ncbi:hypothetical protein QAD02_021517 [Eretmocerus hayati]|uniref:Uncharacterized protein n=1 Tax=Eretmocerus hayati TaxID=131215 RepID=A0ACC2PQZ8_9HYME|nr:hypothetical protein QAD02_021517 [Eretmocerus hayati]
MGEDGELDEPKRKDKSSNNNETMRRKRYRLTNLVGRRMLERKRRSARTFPKGPKKILGDDKWQEEEERRTGYEHHERGKGGAFKEQFRGQEEKPKKSRTKEEKEWGDGGEITMGEIETVIKQLKEKERKWTRWN